jgi:hypothetical protein
MVAEAWMSSIIPRIACLFAILLVASPAHAQIGPFAPVPIEVGDARLRVDRIQPYVVRWNATAITPDNHVSDRGYRTEEVSRGDCARPCWRRVLRIVNANGEETANTVNLFDARTLAPILTDEKQQGNQTLLLRFDGRRVDGRQDTLRPFYHVVPHHRDIRGRMSRPAFDFDNGPGGLYLALMPHRPQTMLRFALLDVHSYENPLTVVDGDYRVYHRTNITIEGRTYDAVVIDALNNFGYWQYWVIEEPPFVLRWIFVDPGGRRTVFNLAPAQPPAGAN